MEKHHYIVDIGEEPGTAGDWTVTATARNGEVEKATFKGRRAPELAHAFVDAVQDFEKRPPTEYPKHVVRNGVMHVALDKEHEEKLGPVTDADKAREEEQKNRADEAKRHYDELEAARERSLKQPQANPKPEFIKPGEDDMNYSERLANWQDQRRGEEPGTNKPLPPLQPVLVGTDPVAIKANAAVETDSTHIPTVEGVKSGMKYEGVDNVRAPDGVHSAPGQEPKPTNKDRQGGAPLDRANQTPGNIGGRPDLQRSVPLLPNDGPTHQHQIGAPGASPASDIDDGE